MTKHNILLFIKSVIFGVSITVFSYNCASIIAPTQIIIIDDQNKTIYKGVRHVRENPT